MLVPSIAFQENAGVNVEETIPGRPWRCVECQRRRPCCHRPNVGGVDLQQNAVVLGKHGVRWVCCPDSFRCRGAKLGAIIEWAASKLGLDARRCPLEYPVSASPIC